MGTGSGPEGARSWRRWLRPVVAVALLAFGASLVPWRDRLVHVGEAGERGVAGEIVGDWRAESIRFRVDADAGVEGFPAAVADGMAAGEAIPVSRSEGDVVPRLEWKPGMLRIFREVDPAGLWGALSLLLAAALTSITRWWRLLAIAGCRMRWTSALRLTFLGFFFNLVLPAGLTGGDVVKAVLVVRENPERRADAFVTVVVDRGLGLLVLMALAAVVVLVSGAAFAELRWPVLAAFGGALLVVWLFLHPAPRRALRLNALLERLPQKERLRSVDRALRLYAGHPLDLALATGLSVLNHVSIAAAIWCIGHAFGDRLSLVQYLGITAIANTVSSLPITPAGWGVGEWAFGSLFHLLGAAATLGVAVSITYRLLTTALGLAGGVFLLMPGGRGVREAVRAADAPGTAGAPGVPRPGGAPGAGGGSP